MKLYFRNFKGEETLIGEFASETDMNKEMLAWFKSHNIHSRYQRSWIGEDGRQVVDYGSWSNFLIIDREGANEQV